VTPSILLISALMAGQPAPGGHSSDVVFDAADQLARLRKSCGPLAAYYCARRLGKDVPYEDFAREVTVEEDGVSLDDVHRLLSAAGARSEVIRVDSGALSSLPTPAIIVLKPSHCVVLDGWDSESGRLRVFEPATRKTFLVPPDAIARQWTGDAIVFGERRVPRWEFFAVAGGSAAAALLLATAVGLARARFVRHPATAGATGGAGTSCGSREDLGASGGAPCGSDAGG
jgi:peptidase C39-like protein